MRQVKDYRSNKNLGQCSKKFLLSFGFAMLSLFSNNAIALQCDAGFVTDSFSVADYNKLAPVSASPSPGTNQSIDGNSTESYLIASNSLGLNGSLTPNSSNTYESSSVDGAQVFRFVQDFSDRTTTRTVSYSFNDKFSNQPQALNNVSLSVYDLDTSIAGFDSQGTRYFRWFDQVTINGYTSTGALVSPIVESKGAGITNTAPFRQNTVTSAVSCSGLEDNCKVSVAFTDPVVRVDVVYGNNSALSYSTNNQANNDPASQIVYIKFDSYCYLPQPRLTYSKTLPVARRANTDQFTVQIKDNADNAVVTNSVSTTTTTGAGNVVTTGTGTTGTYKIDPTKAYTLTEAASGTTSLSNYSDSYVCRRANNTVVTPFDPKNIRLAYGDNWTCTVANTLVYTFSGTVFDDNGGITSPDAEQPIFTSGTYNNTNYFNGIFNTPSESGISGSTVSLVSCANNSISYATQAVGTSGQYQFSVPLSTFGTNRSICLIESRTGTTYPIRTTTDNTNTAFTTTTYNYPNNNFGRVITANAALVLRKFQFINACPTTLNYSGTSTTNDPRTGFSTATIANGNITPGQCIAYKITATNRANIPINNFIMQDKLQSKNDGAAVTSVLANPVASTTDYASDSVPIGQNGTVKTNTFTLAPRSNRDFYFNTKYGTVSGAP